MIKPESIQKVLDTAIIEEVIGEFVRLKRSGSNLKGLSPFTNEKTPSFVVSPAKQIFKCFSSGKGGNVVSFLMEHEQMSFVEAIQWLAKRYGIELEQTKSDQEDNFLADAKHRESLWVINEFAKKHFARNLWHSDEGQSIGLSYFKERSLLESTIQKFDLGFALTNRKSLINAALKEGFPLELLQELGLVNKNKSDFFVHRVIFPIHDVHGRVIAFAGRVMGKSAEGVKYINSPESEIYQKSKSLYGIHLSKNAIRKADECILVEGYLDMISLYQSGIENVVASSGTALTADQVKLIKRHTSNICILYDNDPAGVKAALRGAEIMLEEGLHVQICLLPEGMDPDDFIRSHGYHHFQEYKKANTSDIILYLISQIELVPAENPSKKSQLLSSLIEVLSKIPDIIKRSMYVRQISKRLSISEQIIISELNKLIKSKIYHEQKQKLRENLSTKEGHSDEDNFSEKIPLIDKAILQERDVLRVLVAFGREQILDEGQERGRVADLVLEVLGDIETELDSINHRTLLKYFKDSMAQNYVPSAQDYINHSDPQVSQLALELLFTPYEYSENWENKYQLYLETQPRPEKNFKNDAYQAILRYQFVRFNQQCKLNQKRIEELMLQNVHHEELKHLLKVHKKLLDYRNEIASKLKVVIW